MGNLNLSLGIICGMVIEARTLGDWARDPRIAIGISGARPERAETETRRLVAEGCRVLLSWGVAGGLSPALVPGDLILPAEVIAETGARFALTSSALDRFGRGTAEPSAILGLDHMVMTMAEKAALFDRTGAVAVDMESHRIARVATEAGLPVLAIRAIGDPAFRALPALATRALGEDGQVRIGPVIAGLLRRPMELGTLLQVKRDTDAALAALQAVTDRVIPTVLDAP